MGRKMIEIHQIFTQVEDIFHEFGPVAAQAQRRGAIVAVLRNPYAARYEPDILPMMETLQPVGVQMAGPGQQPCNGLAIVPSTGISAPGRTRKLSPLST